MKLEYFTAEEQFSSSIVMKKIESDLCKQHSHVGSRKILYCV